MGRFTKETVKFSPIRYTIIFIKEQFSYRKSSSDFFCRIEGKGKQKIVLFFNFSSSCFGANRFKFR